MYVIWCLVIEVVRCEKGILTHVRKQALGLAKNLRQFALALHKLMGMMTCKDLLEPELRE